MVNDEPYFQSLYERCFTPIYKYVYFRVRNRELAMDLVQDVFLKAIERNQPIEPETALRYLYTIARNRLIDHFRKKQTVHMESFDEFVRSVPDTTVENPEQSHERQDSRELADRLLDTLSESDREIVLMKYIQELDNNEISTITGKSEANIRQILSRSMKKLRTFYEQ